MVFPSSAVLRPPQGELSFALSDCRERISHHGWHLAEGVNDVNQAIIPGGVCVVGSVAGGLSASLLPEGVGEFIGVLPDASARPAAGAAAGAVLSEPAAATRLTRGTRSVRTSRAAHLPPSIQFLDLPRIPITSR
jgi:hypothetical protein